jgi:hypothetical protein
VKLTAKGQDEYVAFQHIPSIAADAETSVVLAAYQQGLESLLNMAAGWDQNSTPVMEGMLQNLVQFKSIRSQIDLDLERADVTLAAIEKKLSGLSDG